MALPQFPNVFYGTAQIGGKPAPTGAIVTAVVLSDIGAPERHFSLEVRPKGKFGSGNGLKLKVGGSGENIEDHARVSFYVSLDVLGYDISMEEAGHSHFYADYMPHITRVALCQD